MCAVIIINYSIIFYIVFNDEFIIEIMIVLRMMFI